MDFKDNRRFITFRSTALVHNNTIYHLKAILISNLLTLQIKLENSLNKDKKVFKLAPQENFSIPASFFISGTFNLKIKGKESKWSRKLDLKTIRDWKTVDYLEATKIFSIQTVVDARSIS